MNDAVHGVSRRRFITAAAGAAALGAVSYRASLAASRGSWDHDADIIVVGTGIGAATAAYVAKAKGNKVIMVDKAETFGGTTARSAGVLWIPNNFVLKEKGISDEKKDCLAYMVRYSFPQKFNPDSPTMGLSEHAYSLLSSFYDNASPAVDFLRRKNVLQLHEWRGFALDIDAPDYLDQSPYNKVISGRALGVTIADGGTGLGAHLMQQMKAGLDSANIPALMEHRVERVVLNDDGRAIGIEANNKNKSVSLYARKAVIFATGGYAHNTNFVDHYQRSTIYGSCASPASTGDFINIAGAAGARLGNMSGAWRTQVLLEPALKERVLSSGVFYPPGDSMIHVNRYGVRVVNEKRNYNDRTEAHNIYNPSEAEFPNHILFMVYDKRTAEAYAGAYPFPADPADVSYIVEGKSIDELTAAIKKRLKKYADRTGGFSLDKAFAKNLQATVKKFNRFAEAGKDTDFNRGSTAYDVEWQKIFSPHNPKSNWPKNDKPNLTMHPFSDKGPYYAILLGIGALDTNGGPVVDASARVLNTQDKPIPGMYAAGNCIASPSGDGYWGAGCTIGLALTYGYIAANAAHKEKPAKQG